MAIDNRSAAVFALDLDGIPPRAMHAPNARKWCEIAVYIRAVIRHLRYAHALRALARSRPRPACVSRAGRVNGYEPPSSSRVATRLASPASLSCPKPSVIKSDDMQRYDRVRTIIDPIVGAAAIVGDATRSLKPLAKCCDCR